MASSSPTLGTSTSQGSTRRYGSDTASRSTEGPTAEQWAAVKDEIRALYEKKPLKEVRKILEDRHGFRATERMYKARLSQWKFNKNSSDREYQICALLHKQRKDQGKNESAFIINGNHRTLRDLRKYIKGRKMTEDEFLATAVANKFDLLSNNSHVRCITPNPDHKIEEQDEVEHEGIAGADFDAEFENENAILAKGYSPSGSSNNSHPFGTPQTFTSTPTHGLFPASPLFGKERKQSFSTDLSPIAIPAPRSDPYHNPSPYSLNEQFFTPSPQDHIHHNLQKRSQPPGALTISKRRSSNLSTSSIPASSSPASQKSAARRQSSHVHQRRSGSIFKPCRHFTRDLDKIAHQTLYSGSLAAIHGKDDLEEWKMLNPSPDSSSSDGFDFVCSTCRQSNSPHFASMQTWDALENQPVVKPEHRAEITSHPQQLQQNSDLDLGLGPAFEFEFQPPPRPHSRSLLNPSPELSSAKTIMPVPPPAKEHDHSWKWVSRCFLACMILSRIRASETSQIPTSPQFLVAQSPAAREVLRDANEDFAAMLRANDPRVILALSQAMTMLHMHDQGEICTTIIASAAAVAVRVLGPQHPISITVRWMVFVAEPPILRTQREISSEDLRMVWEGFVETYGERDLRTIGSLYNYGYMLNVERNLELCEVVIEKCYKLSCEVLGSKSIIALTALVNYRLCLERMGRTEDAIGVARQAVADSKETLGKNHPRRLETMRLLGGMLKGIGQWEEAENIFWFVLEGRVRMLGKNHTFTWGIREQLVNLLKERDKWREDEEDPEGDGLGGCPAGLRIRDMWEWDPFDSWNADNMDVSDVFTNGNASGAF